MSEQPQEDPVRVADRELLAQITELFDVQTDEALNDSILHPHAVLDTANRRVHEVGLGLDNNEPGAVAAVITMWADGFMAGQRALAKVMGVDLDDEVDLPEK